MFKTPRVLRVFESVVPATVGPSLGRAGLAFLAAACGLLAAVEARAQDTTPPDPFDLIAPANGAWCSPTCALSWQMASDPQTTGYSMGVTTYQLYFDGVHKEDITVPFDVTARYTLGASDSLSAGWHTWYVVAKDPSGNLRSSTSTYSVQIDATAPTAPALVSPTAAAWVGTAAPTFSWTASTDVGSGLASYEIWIDGAAQTTGLGSTATSAQTSIPPKSIFLDGFDTCAGWTMAPISPSTYNWSCDLQNDIQSYALNIYALATSGTIGSTATSGAIDLSNVGTAKLALHESICGAKTYQISISDGSAAGFRLLRDTPATSCRPWINSTLPMDDFTGGAASSIQFTGVATAFNSVFVDSVEIQGVTGGTYTWQVVAVDRAGNRTSSESRPLRYDLPPAPFDLISPADGSATASNKPTFAWNATTDTGSGLAKYQVWIDGALAIDNIAAGATSAAPTSPIADGTHIWQVYAIDAAGAVRHSREKFSIRVDTTPPTAFSLALPADGTTSLIPTPTLCWYCTYDDWNFSSIDHYELVVDGVVARNNIVSQPPLAGACLGNGTQVCSTPPTVLAEGSHTWTVKAVDTVGNARTARETWSIPVDFNPPAAFNLIAPANKATVDSSRPAFSWQASSSSGSGLDHYELYIDNTCVACAIPASATTITPASTIMTSDNAAMGGFSWLVKAVDRTGGSTVATGAPWKIFWAPQCKSYEDCFDGFDNNCDGLLDCADPLCATACGVTPEPSPDAGTDAGSDAMTADAPVDMMVASRDVASTDLPFPATTDAPVIIIADAGQPDVVLPRDTASPDIAAFRDAAPVGDTMIVTSTPDTMLADVSVRPPVVDGGGADLAAFVDGAAVSDAAKPLVVVDGGGTVKDGSAGEAGTKTGSTAAGGCGCTVGGHDARTAWGFPMIILGLLAFWRGSRPRRRRPGVGRGLWR
jgi:MYXO-CTERM domain-containing protein